MKKVMGIILKILLFAVMFAFLELNKNTLLAWFLCILLLAGNIWLSGHQMSGHKFLLFILTLVLFAGIVFVSWPPVKKVPAVSYRNPEKTEIIEVENGKLRGVLNKEGDVEIFTGIPFAKPPVGNLRWKEPQDPDNWEGILEADHFEAMSMQPVNLPFISSLTQIIGYHDYEISLKDNYREPVSEDSLYLNIWAPAGERKNLPVLVYIHGGSLQTGQPWYADYSGEGLAKKGIIVVNIAYRLGVFGFYADENLADESPNHTTGNYGLLDMIKGLEWVQNNIEAFGGDRNNVTVAGESAGSAAVSALCTSPLAEGLFEIAVMESSTVASKIPPHSYRSYESAIKSGNQLKERYGVSTAEELRNIPADKLVSEADSQHHITVDGYVLKEDPYLSYKSGNHNEKAILHGYNAEESGPFILFSRANMKNYEQKIRNYFRDYTDEVLKIYSPANDEEADKHWADIYGAVFFNYSHYCLNRLAVNNDIPVYEYYFSKSNGRLSCWHSGEEVYLYGNIPEGSKLYDEKDRKLADLMSDYFVNFIKTGNPNGSSLPEWPLNNDSKTLIEFGDEVKTIEEKQLKLYEILDKMYGFE